MVPIPNSIDGYGFDPHDESPYDGNVFDKNGQSVIYYIIEKCSSEVVSRII